MATLTVSQVSKVYAGDTSEDQPVVALHDVSFTVNDHEFCSILGHSGCGKTTLLNIIAGFEKASAGQLLMDGAPICNPSWERCVIFQDYALFPWMTVYDNIAFGLEMKRVGRSSRREIIRSHIQLVGLAGFEHRFPHQLSGGMKQRVSIARALAVDPTILLMDEPFAALDAQNRTVMQDEMLRIWQGTRKTVVLVTHSIEEAIALSDRVIVLSKRPGTVKANIEVRLPRPRIDDDPAVVSLRRDIRRLICDENAASSISRFA